MRLLAEKFFAIGEKVGAGNLALYQHRMAGALPSDGIGHLAGRTSLLGENDAAAVGTQPLHGFLDQLKVGHVTNLSEGLQDVKYLGGFGDPP